MIRVLGWEHSLMLRCTTANMCSHIDPVKSQKGQHWLILRRNNVARVQARRARRSDDKAVI
jgi:hypothetical protein